MDHCQDKDQYTNIDGKAWKKIFQVNNFLPLPQLYKAVADIEQVIGN